MSTEGPAFISHAREDAGVALRLARDLKEAAVDVWISDPQPGQEWGTEFQQALLASRAVIVILTPAAVESRYLIQKVSLALTIGKVVIPLLVRECDIPNPLPRSVYIDFRSNYDEGLQHLLRELSQFAGESEGTPTRYVRYQESPNTPEQAEVVLRAGVELIFHEQAEAARKAEAERTARERAEAEAERMLRRRTGDARHSEIDLLFGKRSEAARKAEAERTARELAEARRKAEAERIERERAEAARKSEAERIGREEDRAVGEAEEDECYLEQLICEIETAPPTSRGGAADERVHFTVYHPQAISRERTSRLLAYAHLAKATSSIQAHAGAILEDLREVYQRQSGPATVDIQQGASITVAPYLPNCRFEPRIATFRWLEEWHCVSFALEMERGAPSGNVDGSVDFFVGPVLVASVRITVDCSAMPAASDTAVVPISTTPYESIFVSYSHRDSNVVDRLQQAYRVLGMKYLRDVDELRSGEDWSEALCGFIEKADIFQLCWSRSAKSSAYVQREWRYAWTLHRPFFIRPVYWQKPMPSPPVELRDLHFAQLRLQDDIPWWKAPFAKFFKRD